MFSKGRGGLRLKVLVVEQAGESAMNRSEEMDNASFIASLAPDLREEVLMTSDAAFRETLPPHLIAEVYLSVMCKWMCMHMCVGVRRYVMFASMVACADARYHILYTPHTHTHTHTHTLSASVPS